MNNLFRGLFDGELATVISITDFLLCLGTAMALGLVMAAAYMYRTRYTKSFVTTLALLPGVVCVVIMLVNGNVGTGVAVTEGSDSLVTLRMPMDLSALVIYLGSNSAKISTTGAPGPQTDSNGVSWAD